MTKRDHAIGRLGWFSFIVGLTVAALTWVAVPASATPRPMPSIDPAQQIAVDYGKIPLHFEANRGQADPSAQFLSRGGGYLLSLSQTGSRLILRGAASDDAPSTLQMRWVGGHLTATAAGEAPLPGRVHYLIGRDASRWYTNIPTYAKVRYEAIYPGVDLVYYGNQRQLEYDLVVAPGVDPQVIRLAFDSESGAGGRWSSRLDANGDLLFQRKGGEVRMHKPIIYQEVAGTRRFVSGAYRLLPRLNGEIAVGFQVAAYDRTQPLIIDPVLEYATFLGTTAPPPTIPPSTTAPLLGATGNDAGYDIAVSGGNAYIVGTTISADFPTFPPPVPNPPPNPLPPPGAFDSFHNGGSDIFVAKLNANGSDLVYSTFIGGAGNDVGEDIAVDGGAAYVTGHTASLDFPATTGAFDPTHNGGLTDAFVAKLNAGGNALVYATYYGGSGDDQGYGISVDAGLAYIAGKTTSSNLPTSTITYDPLFNDGAVIDPAIVRADAFIAQFDATGTALIYGTYLGGSGDDRVTDIAFNAGTIFVTGDTLEVLLPPPTPTASPTPTPTSSPTPTPPPGRFPATSGAYDETPNGNYDVFIVRLPAGGTGLDYATFLGGASEDRGTSLAVVIPTPTPTPTPTTSPTPTLLSPAIVYVTGHTLSVNFPTTSGAYDTAHNGHEDAYLVKVDTATTGAGALQYATYLGGSDKDYGRDLVADGDDAYLTGETFSTNFPTADPHDGSHNGRFDVFVSRINTATTGALVYSSFLGGIHNDYAGGIAFETGSVYLTGRSASIDFPTLVGGFDLEHNGNDDVFTLKITGFGVPPVICDGRVATIVGTSGNDVLIGTADQDIINGMGGDDDITGLEGDDILCGGDGNDTIQGGDGKDRLVGGAGYDVIDGDEGNDVISGGDGQDRLDGGFGDDTLAGGADDDILTGGVELEDEILFADLIEDLIKDGLTVDNDTLSGDAGDDQLSGGFGNDVLTGGDGKDTLAGGNGNDTLNGDAGKDTLAGDAGDDQIAGGSGNDLLTGGDGSDSLSGNSGKDTLKGGFGNDTLSGGSGNDRLNGNEDDDTLSGNSGNDLINGGVTYTDEEKVEHKGNDILSGGTGRDRLNGGPGDDQLTGGRGVDTLNGGKDNDTCFSDVTDQVSRCESLIRR